RRNPSGAEARMRERRAGVRTISARLEALGFRGMRPRSLGGRHVWALVGDWHARGLSPGTMKNLMVHLRWWAGAVGKGSVVMRDNDRYGIADRKAARGHRDGLELDAAKLAAVRDERVRLSLELQAAFGLRREEAIKFRVAYADRGDRIALMASWCKGGRARTVPVLTDAQRELLDRIHAFAGKDSLIRPDEKYVQQMGRFERDTRRAGVPKSHRLRHGYAQRRYRELTGFPCAAAGGSAMRAMNQAERRFDRVARETVARELGHARIEVAAVYLGR
ncbi:MAG: integrase domain-containing protein, partial [Rhodospirillales bacterium]|nr:integrase domain-containing protein [Rhodospirillales bacterium]